MPLEIGGALKSLSKPFKSGFFANILGSPIKFSLVLVLILIILVSFLITNENLTFSQIIVKLFIYGIFITTSLIFIHDSIIIDRTKEKYESEEKKGMMEAAANPVTNVELMQEGGDDFEIEKKIEASNQASGARAQILPNVGPMSQQITYTAPVANAFGGQPLYTQPVYTQPIQQPIQQPITVIPVG